MKNFTQGQWFVTENYQGTVIEARHLIPGTFPMDTPICIVDNASTDKEKNLANAKLMAEAGSVANECGLTPRQLLEQRNACLAVLKMVRSNNLQFGFDSSGRRILRLVKEEWALLELVIKKATE